MRCPDLTSASRSIIRWLCVWSMNADWAYNVFLSYHCSDGCWQYVDVLWFSAGMRAQSRAALHPRREEGEQGGGGASGGWGVWQLFQWPRTLRSHPAQQEGRQVCLQGFWEQRSILCKPVNHTNNCSVTPCFYSHKGALICIYYRWTEEHSLFIPLCVKQHFNHCHEHTLAFFIVWAEQCQQSRRETCFISFQTL